MGQAVNFPVRGPIRFSIQTAFQDDVEEENVHDLQLDFFSGIRWITSKLTSAEN